MKRLLSVLLVGLLSLLPFASISEAEAEAAAPQGKIGIIQFMDHPSLAIIEKALREGLAAQGISESDILYGNANGETATAMMLANQFVAEGATVLVPIATPCAVAAVGVAKEAPGVSVIFCAVTDPVAAGIVGDDAPEGVFVTGVSDAVQVPALLDMAMNLTPFANIGFLYNAGEANSVSSVALGKAYCEENGLNFEEGIISNTGELQQVALDLAGRCDVLFTSNDNSVASAMPVYAQVGLDTQTPIYVGADTMVADGGLATLGINYQDLGQQTAEMIGLFRDGTPGEELPVRVMQDAQPIINTDVAQALGIAIPDTLAQSALLIQTGTDLSGE